MIATSFKQINKKACQQGASSAMDPPIGMCCNLAQLSERQLPKRLRYLGGSATLGMSDETSQIIIFSSIESSLAIA
jgi:hypothetical protein